MAEYTGRSDEEMASEFIVNTCQLIPKSFSITSDYMHDLIMTKKPAPKEYTILCGSSAEFYICALQTCPGDTDFLLCNADELAFAGDFPALPSDMTGLADTIQCYKIESYQRYPGFVRLRLFGELNYNWKYKEYDFFHATLPGLHIGINLASVATSYWYHRPGRPKSNIRSWPGIVSGPAIRCYTDSVIHMDSVKSLFCPQWPKEAEHWPIRSRKYGWPLIDTISEVVQNGCHVVYVQHRSCRDDKLQWRLSFSLAEVILLQSWTKIQQIVYHLLRFVVNKELIQKDCPKEDEVLCTYHVKTLMLWTCEDMPPEWWNSASIISICCEMLKRLSEWLTRRCCPNYFIPGANLFHKESRSTTFEETQGRLDAFLNCEILCH